MKYYFYYYFINSKVDCAVVIEDNGKVVGPPIQPIKGCKWEITSEEFACANFFHLKGNYPYPH